jgi:hypothetical protein
LLDGVVAIAALDDFEAWSIQAEGALGHQKDALVVVFAQPAAGGEARAGLWVGRHVKDRTVALKRAPTFDETAALWSAVMILLRRA